MVKLARATSAAKSLSIATISGPLVLLMFIYVPFSFPSMAETMSVVERLMEGKLPIEFGFAHRSADHGWASIGGSPKIHGSCHADLFGRTAMSGE